VEEIIMKADTLKEITIMGRKIFLDTNSHEIVFPEPYQEEEIEMLAYYLIEEGFIPRVEDRPPRE
tara:strand:+ start:2933 stop:3127 length:195 start_codon:yes stop_codon:yes gene_type:complete